ncbi:MAG: hypothetical protein AUI52_04985 [Acidobacteria bacterium 13_1_40CM_2_68_10]|nr:MAG: hypothetical protein AUI52_04985 [Acidobacteria bacterium 13_1_40CM_2_68_10]OLE65268.1 MAG: hypothetical protein AUG03_05580 [Acidobacteria bacterium 13_1_20CM_2_68_14]
MDFSHGAPFILLVLATLVFLALAAARLGLLPGGRLDLSRSVVVHAPADHVWEFVRDLPALDSRHGKRRDFGVLTDWSLRHGDGEGAGSIWRARGDWRGAPYWADVEVIRAYPGRELAIRLCRDSLGTHRGLRDHVGSLALEPIGPDATKITWRLRARLLDPRLLCARVLSSPRLRARLFDQGLRSLKVEIDHATRQGKTVVEVPAGRPGGLTVPPPSSPARIPPEPTA